MATIDRRALFVVAATALLGGCTRYPEVTSHDSLMYIAALRTACSTQNAQRLDKVEKAIESATREGRLTEKETASFRRIIARAREGNWKRAEDDCLAFQQAQRR